MVRLEQWTVGVNVVEQRELSVALSWQLRHSRLATTDADSC